MELSGKLNADDDPLRKVHEIETIKIKLNSDGKTYTRCSNLDITFSDGSCTSEQSNQITETNLEHFISDLKQLLKKATYTSEEVLKDRQIKRILTIDINLDGSSTKKTDVYTTYNDGSVRKETLNESTRLDEVITLNISALNPDGTLSKKSNLVTKYLDGTSYSENLIEKIIISPDEEITIEKFDDKEIRRSILNSKNADGSITTKTSIITTFLNGHVRKETSVLKVGPVKTINIEEIIEKLDEKDLKTIITTTTSADGSIHRKTTVKTTLPDGTSSIETKEEHFDKASILQTLQEPESNSMNVPNGHLEESQQEKDSKKLLNNKEVEKLKDYSNSFENILPKESNSVDSFENLDKKPYQDEIKIENPSKNTQKEDLLESRPEKENKNEISKKGLNRKVSFSNQNVKKEDSESENNKILEPIVKSLAKSVSASKSSFPSETKNSQEKIQPFENLAKASTASESKSFLKNNKFNKVKTDSPKIDEPRLEKESKSPKTDEKKSKKEEKLDKASEEINSIVEIKEITVINTEIPDDKNSLEENAGSKDDKNLVKINKLNTSQIKESENSLKETEIKVNFLEEQNIPNRIEIVLNEKVNSLPETNINENQDLSKIKLEEDTSKGVNILVKALNSNINSKSEEENFKTLIEEPAINKLNLSEEDSSKGVDILVKDLTSNINSKVKENFENNNFIEEPAKDTFSLPEEDSSKGFDNLVNNFIPNLNSKVEEENLSTDKFIEEDRKKDNLGDLESHKDIDKDLDHLEENKIQDSNIEREIKSNEYKVIESLASNEPNFIPKDQWPKLGSSQSNEILTNQESNSEPNIEENIPDCENLSNESDFKSESENKEENNSLESENSEKQVYIHPEQRIQSLGKLISTLRSSSPNESPNLIENNTPSPKNEQQNLEIPLTKIENLPIIVKTEIENISFDEKSKNNDNKIESLDTKEISQPKIDFPTGNQSLISNNEKENQSNKRINETKVTEALTEIIRSLNQSKTDSKPSLAKLNLNDPISIKKTLSKYITNDPSIDHDPDLADNKPSVLNNLASFSNNVAKIFLQPSQNNFNINSPPKVLVKKPAPEIYYAPSISTTTTILTDLKSNKSIIKVSNNFPNTQNLEHFIKDFGSELMSKHIHLLNYEGQIRTSDLKKSVLNILNSNKSLINATEAQLDQALNALDTNNDGLLDYSQFVDFFCLFFSNKSNIGKNLLSVLNEHNLSHTEIGYLNKTESRVYLRFLQKFFDFNQEPMLSNKEKSRYEEFVYGVLPFIEKNLYVK